MRLRGLASFIAVALVAAGSPLGVRVASAQETAPATARAGVAVVDASWVVGSSAGQHATEGKDTSEVDPYSHAFKTKNSYGMQSRLTVRALVVEGTSGDRVALVKTDNYLAQDYLQRRVGQLLEGGDSGVTYDNILLSASHNHSSPYHVTPAAGPWVFTDVFDVRMFEYQARRIAAAIDQAADGMVPVKMGATEVTHTIFKGNVPGPNTADDGTPAGFPRKYGDYTLPVVRFDALDPADALGVIDGQPVNKAIWMNFGQHPESLKGYDLLTAEYLGPLERFVQRETGAPLIFTQGDVGSAEGPSDEWRRNADGTVEAWYQRGFANAERGARYLADSIIEGFEKIGAGEADVPFSSDFPVKMYSAWIPGPISHPYPTVGNCKTEPTVEGRPGAPGVPDCQRAPATPLQQPKLYDQLKELGVPLPDNYDYVTPSYLGLEENTRLRLQAVRLGNVILASCSCEAQVDLIKNFESRADATKGNIHDGYQWDCTPDGPVADPSVDQPWTCLDPSEPSGIRKFTFSQNEWKRALAQIHNDADGWDAPENAAIAESEPADISKIWGNFTKEELSDQNGQGTPGAGGTTPGQVDIIPVEGYEIAIGMGHTGDYLGYTVSYREYMRGDHYRKSLQSFGPHTADYMSTRLVWMAAELKDDDDGTDDFANPLETDPYYKLQAADEARQEASARALGQVSSAAYDAWMAALPNDAGEPGPVTQPKNIERFDAATFTWVGGSNAVDNPTVVVQRRTDDGWENYADQTGEVQTFLDFPNGVQGVAETYAGNQEWRWTANFEAADFGPRRDYDHRAPQIPAGEYRFFVNGVIRKGGENTTYEFPSDPFTVSKWDGIQVKDVGVDGEGLVSFRVSGVEGKTKYDTGPQPDWPIRYPRSYDETSDIRFIKDDNGVNVCLTCSFRPWAIGSEVATAEVTVESPEGTRTISATCGINGQCRTAEPIYQGERAYVAPGGIVDTYGEINGAESSKVDGTKERPTEDPTDPGPSPTTVTITDASTDSVQYSDDATVEASVVDGAGDPVDGADVTFELVGADGTTAWTSTTGADGIARVTFTVDRIPGAYSLTARFDGSDDYLGNADADPFVIEKEDTTLTLSVTGKGSGQALEARLSDQDSDAGIEGRSITFSADGEELGSAQTSQSGVARFNLPAKYRNGKRSYAARFGGDDYYLGSTDQRQT